MIVIDASVLIDVLKDKTGNIVRDYKTIISKDVEVFTRLTQMEILRGARDDMEFRKLQSFFDSQFIVEATDKTWAKAAKIYFDLRKKGKTIKAPIDCLIAQIALENDATLLHKDSDFQMIGEVRPLKNIFFEKH